MRTRSAVADLLAGADDPVLDEALRESDRRRFSPRRALAWALGVAVLVAYPFVFNDPFFHHMMIMVFLYALMAQAWNVLAGYCGQISLGHAVFFGIGAYSVAYPAATFGITPWAGMVLGVLVSLVVAVAIGLPTFRLKGHYFAIATLVIGETVQIVFLRWDFFGAASGIWLPIVRENPLLNLQFNTTKIPYYFIALALLAVSNLFVRHLDRSKLGFYFRAIREEPEAASTLGINLALYKSLAFMTSGAFMSLAGSFYAAYVLVIDPESVFPLALSILVVLIAVMGGVGTFWGPMIGAIVLVPMSELTRIYFGGTGGTVDLMIYGGLIVLICIFNPEGLIGVLTHWITPKPAQGGPTDGDA